VVGTVIFLDQDAQAVALLRTANLSMPFILLSKGILFVVIYWDQSERDE
jgi:hypothetical protein